MTIPTPADLPVPAEPVAPQEAAESPQEPTSEPTPEYVRKLREEAAGYRVKAHKVDEALSRLTSAYAAADGRLVDPSALDFDDELLDDDGFVDPAKVTAAIDGLLAAKPYLASRRPTSPLPMGAQPDAPAPMGLFDSIRARM